MEHVQENIFTIHLIQCEVSWIMVTWLEPCIALVPVLFSYMFIQNDSCIFFTSGLIFSTFANKIYSTFSV